MLFEPVVMSRQASTMEYSLHLSAQEPYLADHCPGGSPLFGTAMGLEAVATAAVSWLAHPLTSINNVRVGRALVLTAPAMEVRIRLTALPSGDVRGVLYSGGAERQDIVHLQADFASVPIARTASEAATRCADRRGDAHSGGITSAPFAVSGAQVYDLFFHGPAFRVVSSCVWRDVELHARRSRQLPPLSRSGETRTVIQPRLLEFALQSAGLWEIAESTRMMIPSQIDHILLAEPGEEVAGIWTARAHRTGDAGIDIDVHDESGAHVMSVLGYRTVALPFPSNDRSLSRLAETLRETSEVSEA